MHKEGKYDTKYTKFKINFIGLPFEIKTVEIDNEIIAFDAKSFKENQYMIIPKDFNVLHISA